MMTSPNRLGSHLARRFYGAAISPGFTGGLPDPSVGIQTAAVPRRRWHGSVSGAVLLTLLSAALYSACFPPLSLWPLIWIALVPLFVAISRQGPLGAALLGLLFGTGIGIGTGTWFPRMVSDYFEQPAWIGWLSLPVVGAAHAGIYCAPFAAWASWLARR